MQSQRPAYSDAAMLDLMNRVCRLIQKIEYQQRDHSVSDDDGDI